MNEQIKKYTIKEEEGKYIELRIKQTKLEIIKAVLLSVIVPILFMSLKTGFFKKEINAPLIFICVGMFILSLLTMVRITIKRLFTFKKIIKEISFDKAGNTFITLVSGIEIKEKISSFSMFEGYKGPQKMKNILDEEFTYRIENYEKGLEFYFISGYFENWEELRLILSEKTYKIA